MTYCLTRKQTQLYIDCCQFAKHEHRNQVRKYTGEPYFNHVLEVSELVMDITDDVNMWCAGVLHDVMEDCGVTKIVLQDFFGEDIATLVEWLTDVSKKEDGNRAVRKAIDLRHLAMAPARAKTVKLADLISNSKSIVEHDKDFARVYIKEKRALMNVLTEGNPILYEKAVVLLHKAEKELNEEP